MASEVFSLLMPLNSQLRLSAARSARDHRDTGFPFLLQVFPLITRLTPGKGLQARDNEVMPSVLDDGCGGFPMGDVKYLGGRAIYCSCRRRDKEVNKGGYK
jgi:hypothetical protein